MSAAKITSHNPWISVVLWWIAALTSTAALTLLNMNHPLFCIASLAVAGCFALAGYRSEKRSRS